MERTKLQERLERGEPVAGAFTPAGQGLETPGVLTWSIDRGAVLELADLADPWPVDFDQELTVHGWPRSGEELTLLKAHVRTKAFDRVSRLSSWTLALGGHMDLDRRWPIANYRPSALHEWLPETGLSVAYPGESRSRLVLEWNRPETRTVEVPDAQLRIQPGARSDGASFSPRWSIDTTMAFSVTPSEPLTLDQHWDRYDSPLLSFVIFAADHRDDLTRESYYDPENREHVVILRMGREPPEREWRPIPGHFLFRAEDVPSVEDALSRWFAVWRKTVPALGLFREVIEQGTSFSAPRFLTLYTAAEAYWKNTKTGTAPWSPRELAARAGTPDPLTGATPRAVGLIGATRNYLAHLDPSDTFSAEEMGQTYASTRRLHALVQACLLREIGVGTSEVERLLREHYANWPIP